MKEKVSGLSAQEMDKTDREAWIDYYCAEFQIDPIVMYPESKTVDIEEKSSRSTTRGLSGQQDGGKNTSTDRATGLPVSPLSGDPGLFGATEIRIPSTHLR